MAEKRLTREIEAPIAEVFKRLADVRAYGAWLPETSASDGCTVTAEGPVGLGTTYVDHCQFGEMFGEIVEFEEPTSVVFLQRFELDGNLVFEARQTNTLKPTAAGTTIEHHFMSQFSDEFKDFDSDDTDEGERGVVLDALKEASEH